MAAETASSLSIAAVASAAPAPAATATADDWLCDVELDAAGQWDSSTATTEGCEMCVRSPPRTRARERAAVGEGSWGSDPLPGW